MGSFNSATKQKIEYETKMTQHNSTGKLVFRSQAKTALCHQSVQTGLVLVRDSNRIKPCWWAEEFIALPRRPSISIALEPRLHFTQICLLLGSTHGSGQDFCKSGRLGGVENSKEIIFVCWKIYPKLTCPC